MAAIITSIECRICGLSLYSKTRKEKTVKKQKNKIVIIL